MIRTVIFDLGQVIVPFDFERGFRALGELCSLPPAEVRARVAATDLVERFEKGAVAPDDFVRRFSGLLGLETSYERFCEVWSSIFLPETLIPEELVAGLRDRYRTLLLSNTNAIHFDMIRESYPLVRLFHGSVLSYEVGATNVR